MKNAISWIVAIVITAIIFLCIVFGPAKASAQDYPVKVVAEEILPNGQVGPIVILNFFNSKEMEIYTVISLHLRTKPTGTALRFQMTSLENKNWEDFEDDLKGDKCLSLEIDYEQEQPRAIIKKIQ